MTNWVMVPVPEELEEEVAQRVMFLQFAQDRPAWDAERVDAHLRALEIDARALACAIALGAAAGRPRLDTDLALEFGLRERELLGLAQEVNDHTIDPFPGALVFIRSEKVPVEDGGGVRHEFRMNDDFAVLICAWADENRSLLESDMGGSQTDEARDDVGDG